MGELASGFGSDTLFRRWRGQRRQVGSRVRAYEERVSKRTFDNAAETSAAFALVADRTEAWREHPAVHRAEVELGMQDRAVKGRGGVGAFAEDGDAVDVGVHGNHVAPPRRRLPKGVGVAQPLEAAAEVEFSGGGVRQGLLAGLEVWFEIDLLDGEGEFVVDEEADAHRVGCGMGQGRSWHGEGIRDGGSHL